MAELSNCTFLRSTSVAGRPRRQDGIPIFESDSQNEGLLCLGEGTVTLDGKKDRSSSLQVLTVNKEAQSVLGPSASQASARTASTELYVPPHSKNESPQNGCVSSFQNRLLNARQETSPVQKVEDITRAKVAPPENGKKIRRKRKRTQTELAAEDVDAAIGRIISAAEAVVVGNLIMDASLTLTPSGQDRSICLEAALSVAKARHVCGLDQYDLNAASMDPDDLAMHDLDHSAMLEAYADVGIVDVPENERQLDERGSGQNEVCARICPSDIGGLQQSNGQTISEACKKPAKNNKSVEFIPHSSEIQTFSIVAQRSEVRSHLEACQVRDKTGDDAEFKKTVGNIQLPVGSSAIETRDPLKVGGAIIDEKVKESAPSCKSAALVSSDSKVEIGNLVEVDHEIDVVDHHQQDTEVLEEMDSDVVMEAKAAGVVSTVGDMQCQRDLEFPNLVLSATSHTLDGIGHSEAVGEPVTKCITVPTQQTKSVELISSWLEDKAEETGAQAHEAKVMIRDSQPNSDMACPEALLQLGSAEGIQHKAGQQEEVQAGDAVAIEDEIMDNNRVVRAMKSTEPLPELSVPSKDMTSPETKWSCPDGGKDPVILKDPSQGHATRNSVTLHVSRWFGGWSGNAQLNQSAAIAVEGGNTDARRVSSISCVNDIGSEDAVPEQNAFLARQKSTPDSQETVKASHRISANEADADCLVQNDEGSISEKSEGADPFQSKGSHSQQALHMSQGSSLCSFVPCSISPPAGGLFSPSCHEDHQSEMLAATVEACARTAMNIIDNRKVSDCQQTGQAPELETRTTHHETSGQEQNLETRRGSVSSVLLKDATVKRTPTIMRKFSTTTDSLSLLLHAVDVVGKSLSNKDSLVEGDGLERPSTPSPNLMSRSSPLNVGYPEESNQAEQQSADCDTQSTTDLQDITLNVRGKNGLLKKKGRSSPDMWMCADLSESPPLLWPRGKKRRLTACRVIDSDSTGWLHDNANDHQMVQNNFTDKEGSALQSVTPQQSSRPSLRHSTRSKPCHDPKTLFNGLQFLLTGFSSEKKEKLSKCIERYGGGLLANVPAFSPKQRFKRKGVDCGSKSPPIVIAPQQVRTHKYLYGCAVGSPLLNARWISASVSSVKCLPYHEYRLNQMRADCVLQADDGGVSRNSERSPLFVGFQLLFHGQQDFISQLSTLAKHAGGKVIRKMVQNVREQKRVQKLVGVVVVEGSNNLPLDLQRAASELKFNVVDAEWMVVTLLHGKLQPFLTDSTPPSSALPSQQSSASKAGEPLQRYSHRRAQFQRDYHENRGDADSGIELLVKKLKERSLPEENWPTCSSGRIKSGGGKELEEEEQGLVNTCWLGMGFTSPPEVPQLADRLLAPYSHSMAHRKLPKKILYYEAFLCNRVEYFLGDIVEVRASTATSPPFVARIEGLWSEEGGDKRLPQTRAFPQGVRKKAFKNVVLKCRRFYRPSDTGFSGHQGGGTTTNELYLSNDIDNTVSASDIVRRVRMKLKSAGEVVHCNNWYDGIDAHNEDDGQERAAASLTYLKKGTTTTTATTSNKADYFCSFFYDHSRESLHRIKLDV